MAISVLFGRSRVAAGLRDKLVTIQQRTAGVSTSQMPIETWTTLATTYMSRQDSLADEQFRMGAEGTWTQTQWHLPYRADMDPELVDVPKDRRVVWSGTIFNIRAAALMDRRKGIELITLAGGRAPL